MAGIQRITANLWFDKNGEEAADFYISIFKNSQKGKVSRFGKAGFEIHGMPEGTAAVTEFFLDGQQFLALNGGPIFKFTEAVSFVVNCDTQEEIDYYWEKLNEGGDPKSQQCGWLKDKFGLSWQVVPAVIGDMMTDPDPGKRERVMNAVLQMKKINLAEVQKAFEG